MGARVIVNAGRYQPIRPGTMAPFRVFKLRNNNPVELLRSIRVLEAELGERAELNFLPLHPGDVPETTADISELEQQIGSGLYTTRAALRCRS